MNAMVNEVSTDLSDAVSKHIPFHIACDFLKAAQKPVGRSWKDVLARNMNAADFLTDLLTEVICFSRKSVFAYEAKNKGATLDLSRLASMAYVPTPITQSKNHKLFNKNENARFSAYNFLCTKRANETYILKESDLTPDARTKHWTPDSVIKLNSRIVVTLINSIVYDSENKLLFVLVDDLRYSLEENSFDIQAQFCAELIALIPDLTQWRLLDFFPSINGIYSKQTEGLVHRLGFECITGVTRDERLKPGQLDLREEKYHTEGKAAIGGDIQPFKVGVTWQKDKFTTLKSEVELEINGNRQALHKQGGVFKATLTSVGTFGEACFAMQRLGLYV